MVATIGAIGGTLGLCIGFSFMDCFKEIGTLILKALEKLYREKFLKKFVWYHKKYIQNFKQDSDLQQVFTMEVRNRYNVLCEEDIGLSSEPADISKDYNNSAEAVKVACKKHVPERQKRRRPKIATDARVTAARAKLEATENSYHNRPTNEARHGVKLCKDALESAYNQAEEELLDK